MDYDVVILGGGIIGCAAAYELSKYSLNIALIEKDYDIADDVALINTSVIYDGVECEDTLVSKLELMGNQMFDEVTSKFNVPFKRTGGMFIASNKKEEENLNKIYDRAIKRGIKNIYMLDSKAIYEIDPNLDIKVEKALYSENMGVVCPYDLAIAYGEIAFDNGVNFKLEEEVIAIQKISKGFRVETNKNKFTCKMVINTSLSSKLNFDDFKTNEADGENKKLKYFLIEKDFKGIFSNILINVNENDDRVYTIPTLQGTTIAAVSTEENIGYNQSLEKISLLVSDITDENINIFYNSIFHNNPVLIDDSAIDKGYIKIAGKHYGEVTMTPAIAKIVCETVVSNMNCQLKKDFNDKRREVYKFRDLDNKERERIIKVDSKYGKIICACQKITEGEIVDAIRRPLGARTVEGVKRRTGVTLGSCQGSYCLSKIVTILARETNKNLTDIVKDSKSSKIILNRIKEFDGV